MAEWEEDDVLEPDESSGGERDYNSSFLDEYVSDIERPDGVPEYHYLVVGDKPEEGEWISSDTRF